LPRANLYLINHLIYIDRQPSLPVLMTREVLLPGGVPELSHEIGILAGFILVAMTIAVLRFNKRLD
jgi:hypothetical protein